MKNINELRELDYTGLNEELLNLRKEQFNLRLTKASGSLEKTHKMNEVRRNIAQVKTIMTEKAGA